LIASGSKARKRKRELQVLGVLGGVASGKSFVANELARLGAVVINADRIGHEVLEDHDVREAIRRRWGDEVFSPAGTVDRAKLAAIVFGTDEKAGDELKALEQLTHPRINKRILEEIDDLDKTGKVPAVVLDAPVMLKAGWNEFCDKIVFVDAPHDVRLQRARQRGWNEKEFERREAAQESLQAKRQVADVIIDNSASQELTRRSVEQFWCSLGLRLKRVD